MYITIISGSLEEFTNGQEAGCITIIEDDMKTALAIANRFLDYGKTVVIEPEGYGD